MHLGSQTVIELETRLEKELANPLEQRSEKEWVNLRELGLDLCSVK